MRLAIIMEKKMVLYSLYKHSKLYPKTISLVGNDGTLTYQSLWDSIVKLSIVFKQNLIHEKKIIIKNNNSVGFVVYMFALLLNKNTIVIVDENTKATRYNEIFTENNGQEGYFEVKKELPNIENINKLIEHINIDNDCDFPDENDISVVLYTTGTTGKSKAVPHTFASEYVAGENILSVLDIRNNEKVMVIGKFNHSFALRRLYAYLIHGCTIIMVQSVHPLKNIIKYINEYNIAGISMNPSVASMILYLDNTFFQKYSNQIKYIEFSSSPLSPKLLNIISSYMPSTEFYNIFASTEAGIISGFNITKNIENALSIGRKCKYNEIKIVDELFNEVNGIGYLAIKSPGLMKSYLDLSAVNYDKDGYYVTSDLVYINDEGFIYFEGRKNDLIYRSGLKISPIDIETIMILCPGILDCACIGIDDKLEGQVPVLFIVIDKDNYNQEDVYSYMYNNLDNYQYIKSFYIIDKIPKTFNGKILRNELYKIIGGKND